MKQLMRLLIVAIIAGAVATIIVQRDRIRQVDREALAGQIRDGIQSVLKRGEETAASTLEAVEAGLDTAEAKVEEAAEAAAEVAEEVSDAVEEASETG